MFRLATAIAVRRQGRTVIAALGQGLGSSGGVRNVIRRSPDSKIIWVSVGSQGANELLRTALDDCYRRCGNDVEDVALDLAHRWIATDTLRPVTSPLLLGTAERILRVGPAGDVLEPQDGTIAIGEASELATGAARALIAYTEFDAEKIAREALRLAADETVRTPCVEILSAEE